MTDQEDKINLGKIVFDDNNQERKFWACLGQTCSRSLIVFLSQLFVVLLIIFGCFWRIKLSKNLRPINCLSWNFVQCGRIQYTLTKIMNNITSAKIRVFISLVGPSETTKSLLTYKWLKIGTFQPRFDII